MLSTKGLALYHLGKHEEAINQYDKILDLEPNHVNTLINKGLALDHLGNFEEALVYYDKALEIEPNNSLAMNNKGVTLDELGKHEEALVYIDKALEIDPNSIAYLDSKGDALANLGRYEEAMIYYDKVLEIDMNDEEVLKSKNELLQKMGKPQIPDWIRNNAEWWAQGAIGDSDFVSGIQYLIKEGIMQIPETAKAETTGDSQEIPSWIKSNADWWAQGLISDDDFLKGIQYLVEQGIMVV